MNYFELIKECWRTKSGETLSSWTEIDDDDQGKIKDFLNDSLTDLWLNFDYIFKNRDITMTCVVGQNNYDMPFNGKLRQNGLLLQPVDSDGEPAGNKRILKYSYHLAQFYQSTQQGEPFEFTITNNQLLLSPVPDRPYILTCLYESTQWALSVTTVSSISASGQNVLNIADVTDKSVGDIIYINKDTATEETGVIASIGSNSLTLVGNLTFTHQVGERVTKEKQNLVYENDEPNFPSEYHNILVYAALSRAFYNDPIRQNDNRNQFKNAAVNMISNSKNAQDGGQRVMIKECRW